MKVLKLNNNVVNESERVEIEAKGEDCISLKKVTDFLNDANGEDVQFDISTLGGDLYTAITIHDLIKSYSGKTTGKATGLLASAGTVILEACDERVMDTYKLFLIHNGSSSITGNIYDFQKAVIEMSKTDALMVKIYKERTGLPEAKIVDLMKKSDWLSPYEALEMGFIDRIEESENKIAASVVLQQAQGKIEQSLLTKLENKMKIFGKEKKEVQAVHILALKDGSNILCSEDKPAVDAEVSPVGAATLGDGEYELADGSKISVSGGMITNVTPAESPEEMAQETLMNTVAEMLVKSEAKIEAMIEAKLKPLQALSSQHQPEKGKGPVNPSQASVYDTLQAKVEEKKAEIAEAAEKKRKGV